MGGIEHQSVNMEAVPIFGHCLGKYIRKLDKYAQGNNLLVIFIANGMTISFNVFVVWKMGFDFGGYLDSTCIVCMMGSSHGLGKSIMRKEQPLF